MSDKYYVVADRSCPGTEFSDYEEARKYLRSLQSEGKNRDARILGPGLNPEPSDPSYYPSPFD